MNYKWTVLFLVHAATKQTREHIRTLIEILKKAPHREEIKVLLLYSALQHSDDAGVRNQTVLREMVYDTQHDRLVLSEVNEGYGAMDIGDDTILKKIFSSIRNDYPSERFLLFTWDHGSGFGIFKTNPGERGWGEEIFPNFEMDAMHSGTTKALEIPEETIRFEVIDNENPQAQEEESYRGHTPKAGNGKKKKRKTSMLTNDEIRNTIKQGLGDKKVDLLVMMNCAMQMIETGYAMHDTVEYLVAPETCIFWAGYDYKRIIGKLCTDPDISTEALGRYVIDTIEPYYKEARSGRYFKDLVVSLVKPGTSLHVKDAIDDAATQLTGKLADAFHHIRETRETCEDLTQKYVAGVPYHYVDFLHCMSALSPVVDGIDMEKLKQAMKNYAIHIIKGGNYQDVNEREGVGEVNGCTIYYPPTAHDADNDFYYDWFYKAGHWQTLFARHCSWKGFLENYFRNDRHSSI